MNGRAWRFGDDVDTDAVIPGRFLVDWSRNPQKLRDNCFIDARPEFAAKVAAEDFVTAGRNFGCGSSREGAALALKLCGVRAVIAVSFARIFYRNCINVGLPALESPDAGDIADGDTLDIDMQAGLIRNLSQRRTCAFRPVPPFLLEILDAGGLAPYVQARLARSQAL
ncbi:MAG: 3-isopropylmalate dehydratase small subunit [Rhodospirillaceae bacterium]